jgi:hypothetical protein
MEASGDGTPVHGGMKETRTCGTVIVDCAVSSWTVWDQCDKQCGGGQTQRHRQINRFPKNGGRGCEHDLVQSRGCNEEPCDLTNCKTSLWSEWGGCSTSCGSGQQSRGRQIVSKSSVTGKACRRSSGRS